MYSLPVFRGYINKLRPSVEGVAMKIKKLFSEIENSSEPVRTSNYVRYLGVQHYEPGMQYNAHECLLQLLVKIYPNFYDDFKKKEHLKKEDNIGKKEKRDNLDDNKRTNEKQGQQKKKRQA